MSDSKLEGLFVLRKNELMLLYTYWNGLQTNKITFSEFIKKYNFSVVREVTTYLGIPQIFKGKRVFVEVKEK